MPVRQRLSVGRKLVPKGPPWGNYKLKTIFMAKKGPRQTYGLTCTVCKSRNYITTKNKANAQAKNQEKLTLKKYCPVCKKHTEHKETAKLK